MNEYKKHPNEKNCNSVHWGYKGATGPDNWKTLCPDFADCGGKAQSPVNISTKETLNSENLQAIHLNYGKTKVNIVNNGHSVQFNVDAGNTANLNGKTYTLLQFHYHSPSEHTIDGKYFPLEVHFVHRRSDKDFAVIGVMFVEGKENPLFKAYLDKFPETPGEFQTDNNIDLSDLLPENKSYYFYKGSLTTPPCSEIVNWHVLTTPLEASKEQMEKFSKILNYNNRPVMPLNGRKIKKFDQ